MSKTGDELRTLADVIRHVTEDSSIMGVAAPIVRNCIEHLRAVARIHDLNANDR